MSGNKTIATDADVDLFLDEVEPLRRRKEARRLDALFRDATGFAPRIWGTSIVGYGRYHYQYDSGRSGEFLATGFAPRKAHLVLYIMPGYSGFGETLDRLGKFRLGKSCLYLTSLDAVDEAALKGLIKAGLADLGQRWPVIPT
ncbi:MAG: DUF1801 domain-containing protein [Rhodobacteraceae bacterium]|nr:DUF1801 domain-containing protein [Paracoccaceae bacterium]